MNAQHYKWFWFIGIRGIDVRWSLCWSQLLISFDSRELQNISDRIHLYPYPGRSQYELRSLWKHFYSHISPAVMHYWRYWSDKVTTTTCRQTTLRANMSPYKSLVKKGSRSVCEKYTSVIARITSVGRRSLQIFLSSVVTSDSNPRNVGSWRMDFSII